jgi:hypothetical protein
MGANPIIRGPPVGEREVEAESGSGVSAKALMSKAVDSKKDFEATWA